MLNYAKNTKQLFNVNSACIPNDCLEISTLRAFELELHRKALVNIQLLQQFTPLWFLAETECNTFLWQRGLSLDEKVNFEFWVAPLKSIDKRLSQTRLHDTDNPFSLEFNNLNSSGDCDRLMLQEEEYLLALAEILTPALPHLNALSKASVQVLREFDHNELKALVVLPNSSPKERAL